MTSLRHYLLVALLFAAQFVASAHAVGHALENDEALPTHVCELCLTAHNIGSALPSVFALPPLPVGKLLPASLETPGRAAFPPPLATQRGPPAF